MKINEVNIRIDISPKREKTILFFPSIVILISSIICVLAGFDIADVGPACIITIIGAVVGGITLITVIRKWPDYFIQGIQCMIFSRLLLTILGLLFSIFILGLRDRGFFLFTGVFYVIGLMTETVLILRLVREGLLVQKDESKVRSFADKK